MADMASQVWFFIIPTNEVAEAIVNDDRNSSHVAITDEASSTTSKVIQVAFDQDLDPNSILSFGRKDCSIRCDLPGTALGHGIANYQCSFFLHNKSLIFRDNSSLHTSAISPLHLDSPGTWHMDRIPRQRAIPRIWRLEHLHGVCHVSSSVSPRYT